MSPISARSGKCASCDFVYCTVVSKGFKYLMNLSFVVSKRVYSNKRRRGKSF